MTAMQSHWLVQRLFGVSALQAVGTFLFGQVAPFLFLCMAFAFLYGLVPNTRVRPTSALVGGAAAAILWHLAGLIFTAFIAGSTRYTAIYSSFAVLVVFLIWLYVGWLIVFVGAQIAYFYQYPSSYLAARQRQGLTFRERLALAALVEVTRRALTGQPPARVEEIAVTIDAPVKSLEDVIDDLVARGVLLRATEPEGVALARGPDEVTAADVLAIVADPEEAPADDVVRLPAAVAAVLGARDRALHEALGRVTLRTLAGEPPREAAVTPLVRHRER
jgi:membrane protein